MADRAMGLRDASGKYGAKTQLRARFPGAFFEAATLEDAALGVPAARTLAVLDGTIVARQVFAGEKHTFADYCAVNAYPIAAARRAAEVIVVAYDDPHAVTPAKREEQSRRDLAQHATSAWDRGDAYTREELVGMVDVAPLVSSRAARMRCLDEIARLSLMEASAVDAVPAAPGLEDVRDAFRAGGALVYDGVDPAGAARPLDAPRVARVAGNAEKLVAALTHGREAQPMGEADLKLTSVVDCARASGAFDLGLIVTVDTDTICIELLARACAPIEGALRRVVCARQRAKRDAMGAIERNAYYQCLDVDALHEQLRARMWAVPDAVPEHAQRGAAAMLAVGLALCGCDFVWLRGLRADVVLDVVIETTRADADAYAALGAIREPAARLRELAADARAFAAACARKMAQMPRMGRQSKQVAAATDEALLRAVWTAAYWSMNEVEDVGSFGFAPAVWAPPQIRAWLDCLVSRVERAASLPGP